MNEPLTEAETLEGRTIRRAVADKAEAYRRHMAHRGTTLDQVEQLCPAEKVARGLKILDAQLAELPELEQCAIRTAFNEVIDHAVIGGLQACIDYHERVGAP